MRYLATSRFGQWIADIEDGKRLGEIVIEEVERLDWHACELIEHNDSADHFYGGDWTLTPLSEIPPLLCLADFGL